MKYLLIVLSLSSFLISGCASSKSGLPDFAGSSNDYRGFRSDSEKNSGEQAANPADEKRMILYNASIDIKVKNTDTTLVRLKSVAARYEGYAMNLGNTYATIRVKASNLNAALADISTLGKVTHKNISGEDVTDQFYDFTIRLENAQKARSRYLELLAKAENVEAALKVEKELERLNGEIDLLEGKINRLKHLEQYSTITIYIEQKKKLGILGYVSVGLYKGIKWLFVRG